MSPRKAMVMSPRRLGPQRYISGAIFSPCRTYRYTLIRRWDRYRPMIAFIGLNPSTADEIQNDPTVSRCIKYAERWDFGGMYMLNIFAHRSTDPKQLYKVADPIGPDNDKHILSICGKVAETVACWGNHGDHLQRGRKVAAMLPQLLCLGINKGGQPKHPLYIRADQEPMDYKGGPRGGEGG